MEFNPFKWFGKKETEAEEENGVLSRTSQKSFTYSQSERKDIKESGEKYQWNIGIQLPDDVQYDGLNTIITEWSASAHVLRKKPEDSEAREKIVECQAAIYSLFGDAPARRAQAEVLLANISIDIEQSQRGGEFFEQCYQTYSALGEINVFNTILKGKSPEWAEKYLPTLSKMAARGLSVRTLLSSGVVFGGSILAGAALSPWILGALVTAVGAIHGANIAKAWSRRIAEEKFEKEMEDLKNLAETIGVENFTQEEISTFGGALLKGAHRFGKVIGIDENLNIDERSIPAQLLMRIDTLCREQVRYHKDEHADIWADQLQQEDVELEQQFAKAVIGAKSEGMKNVFAALRKDQQKEFRHAVVGGVGGALLSTAMRAVGAMAFRGQSLGEFVKSHFSFRSDVAAFQALQKGAGEAAMSARIKLGALGVPGGINPEEITPPDAEAALPAIKPDIAGQATSSAEATVSTEAATPSIGEQAATESVGQAEPAVPSDGEQPEAAPEMISVSQVGLEHTLGKDFYIFESGGHTIIEGHIGGKGLLHATSHHDQALRVLLSRVYGDGLAQKYGGTIPTHALDAIENVIQNLKNPALVEKIVGEKVDLLSIDPDAKTVRLEYDTDALNKLIRHGLDVATHDAGGTNTSHDLWEKRLVHPVEDFKAEEQKGSAVSEGGEEKRAGAASERVKGAVHVKSVPPDDVPKIGSKENIALERAGKVITDETIDRVPGIHPRPPVIPVEAATGSVHGITAEAVSATASESITGKAIGKTTESIAAEAIPQPRAEASVSAKAEAPAPEKITAKAADGKIIGEAVSEEGTESVKAESVPERKVPDFTPEQTYQHMLDSLQKGKYAINPYVVEQSQSLRISAFIERLVEVKAGKSDLMTAFSSDQYSLKEYEKLAKYITDHEPTSSEKRMLLRNYLLSKEK